MKKLLTALSLIILVSILIAQTTKTQEKEYVGKGTLDDWQTLISNQDDVPKSKRDRVIQKFVYQLQQQLAADTLKKK